MSATSVPEKYEKIFAVVAAARDAAIKCVRDAYAAGRPLHGWEVDAAGAQVIDAAGYGPQFIHRIGHNIGQEVHGNGANMDNLETHDERLVLRRTCFSVEPGIYFDEFGVRSEVNVFVDGDGQVHVTGGLADEDVADSCGLISPSRDFSEPSSPAEPAVAVEAGMNDQAATISCRRRQFLRLSVRGLVVLVLVIGVGVGWIIRCANPTGSRKGHQANAWLGYFRLAEGERSQGNYGRA